MDRSGVPPEILEAMGSALALVSHDMWAWATVDGLLGKIEAGEGPGITAGSPYVPSAFARRALRSLTPVSVVTLPDRTPGGEWESDYGHLLYAPGPGHEPASRILVVVGTRAGRFMEASDELYVAALVAAAAGSTR